MSEKNTPAFPQQPYHVDLSKAEASARLIRAADDLLAACERSRDLLMMRLDWADITDEEKSHLDILRAAIAKAKNE